MLEDDLNGIEEEVAAVAGQMNFEGDNLVEAPQAVILYCFLLDVFLITSFLSIIVIDISETCILRINAENNEYTQVESIRLESIDRFREDYVGRTSDVRGKGIFDNV